ncbi:MAG: asparaginase [Candidatus Diapherotrites archaeon]|nr:asparaginase [Candidatus Diapherotrites archaeon]
MEKPDRATAAEKKPRIFMVGLGGTIAAKEISSRWISGHYSQKELLRMDPKIEHTFDVKTSNLFRIHSADTQPEHWLSLANLVYYNLEEGFDGIVVTHGTDTMHYTSAAMSFLIQNLSNPIVFTGSQIIHAKMGSDAPKNIYDSLMVASYADLAEVVIVFNGNIFRANRAKKVAAADFDAYKSSGIEPLGFVQHDIALNGKQVRRKKRKPKLFSRLETDVSIVEVHPGLNPKSLEAVANSDLKGIVLRGYGLGNYPVEKNSLTPAINSLAESGIPVVLTTQCRMGPDWKNVFFKEIGTRYDNANVILGYDMRPHTALVKLMWVLAQTSKPTQVKKMMQANYAGEITPNMEKYRQKKR